MSNIELEVNGNLYGGWKSLRVDTSMNQFAGAFGFTATDLFPGNFGRWKIKMGDECTVVLNGEVLITGYVDQISIGYDSESHNIQIAGRDKTADLVDCSFYNNVNEWKNISVRSIIKRLVTPYGILISVDPSVEPELAKK